jgi:uncharacterized protein (UPF0276 family)
VPVARPRAAGSAPTLPERPHDISLAPRFGLGLRKPHYHDFLEGDVPVDFVEVISENFMVPGGRRDVLRRVREKHPVALHGVSMSIGSADGIDRDYLLRLRALADEVEPMLVSDHLCWTRTGGFIRTTCCPCPIPKRRWTWCAATSIGRRTFCGGRW